VEEQMSNLEGIIDSKRISSIEEESVKVFDVMYEEL